MAPGAPERDLEIEPLSAAVGAEVRGVDLSTPLDQATFAAIRSAWLKHWRAGDLLLWDNRAVLHRRDPFDDTARRIVHRTQINGTAVV